MKVNGHLLPQKLVSVLLIAGQLKATSPDLTLNGCFYRAECESGLELGFEIVLK